MEAERWKKIDELLDAVLGLAAWLYFSRGGGGAEAAGPDWSRAKHVQLTGQAGTEFYPALAPDGRTFAYAAEAAGNFDIYVQRVGGKNPLNLTRDSAANDTQPAFSPDGDSIAFRSERDPPGIYVMGATGENVRRLSGGGFHPSWSPDGKKVAGTYRPAGKRGIGYFSFETNRYEMAAGIDSQPMWLPDSRRLVFGFEGKALIADTATGRVREVFSRQPERIRSVDVSADGRLLCFTVVSSENDIWLLDLD